MIKQGWSKTLTVSLRTWAFAGFPTHHPCTLALYPRVSLQGGRMAAEELGIDQILIRSVKSGVSMSRNSY